MASWSRSDIPASKQAVRKPETEVGSIRRSESRGGPGIVDPACYTGDFGGGRDGRGGEIGDVVCWEDVSAIVQ